MEDFTVRITPVQAVVLLALCITVSLAYAQTQNDSPVRIAFDEKSERIDLVTGKELPDYTYVRRGSIQFFLSRLDTPDDFVNFYHDGIRQGYKKDLASMEKVQEQFGIWRLRYKSGSKNTPRIHHLAVSFIPLSLESKEPERRVYLLLKDLTLIEWGKDR